METCSEGLLCFFFLLGVVEVYRVTRRVELGIKATAVCSDKLQQLLKDINRVWNNLMGFMSLAKLAVRYSEKSNLSRAVKQQVCRFMYTAALVPLVITPGTLCFTLQ